MTALTLRLPNDSTHASSHARRRGTSINRLIEEMATLTLAEFDARPAFSPARAAAGKGGRGLALLTKPRRAGRRDDVRAGRLQ